MNRDELIDFLGERLGICGCSDSDGAVIFLRELLEVGSMRGDGHKDEADAVIGDLLPEGDCLERNLPIYWLNAAGLLEHGWEMNTYTLTEEGLEVLAALREASEGDEDDENIVWN